MNAVVNPNEADDDLEWGLRGIGDEEVLLEPGDAKTYLSVGALFNYLARDRMEILFGVKEVLRK